MKKITLLCFAFIALAFSFNANAQCNYTLEMNDSWGDGWNGNTMDVLVDGVAVLSGVTLSSGTQGTLTFSVSTGQDVTTNWIGGGSYGSETSYRILDFSDVEVGAGAQSSITTGTITAVCPSCSVPAATFTVVEDCALGFTVDIDVTDMGDATSFDVQESGVSVGTITATGVTNVGPFTNDNAIDLILIHDGNVLCSLEETGLVNALCPTVVTCGTPTDVSGVCYDNNANMEWLFTSSDNTSSLILDLTAGQMETCCDYFTIYDGTDASGDVLYSGNGALALNTYSSTGTSLYVLLTSDSSISCSDQGYTPIDFSVNCLSCTPATVTAVVVDDCATSGGFNIEVDITDLGSATTMTVSDDQGSATQAATATGILTFGPYANGTEVAITVANDQDAVCTTSFMGLGQSACPPANDLCSSPEAITVGVGTCGPSVTGNNTGATDSGEAAPSYGWYSGGDIWYSFTAPASATEITIDISVNNFSTAVAAVYNTTMSCGSLEEVDSDGVYGTGTITLTGLTGGDSYLLRFYDWGNDNFGELTYCVSSPPTCPEPTALTVSNVTETSADLGWTEAGTATTWNIEWGTAPLTQGAGTMVTGTTTNPYALTGLTTETEYVYYVQADCGGETSAWSGPYTFSTYGPAPANDECVDAEAISCGDTVSGSTEYATDSGNNASNDVWYVIAGTSDGDEITASLCGSGFDTYIRVFDACGGTQVAFDDDDYTNCGSSSSQVTFTSDGVTTYYIMVEGFGSSNGDFDLAISCVTLSAQDFDNGIEFSYYPNPVNDNLTLKAQKDIENIAVYNMLGQEVLRTAPNAVNTDVDMSNLQAGAYFVKVTIGATTETVRVIKN